MKYSDSTLLDFMQLFCVDVSCDTEYDYDEEEDEYEDGRVTFAAISTKHGGHWHHADTMREAIEKCVIATLENLKSQD